MEVVLIILGVLGFGAILIAGYVFTVAARNYVSNDTLAFPDDPATGEKNGIVARGSNDRRRGAQATFPLIVNSVVIPHDRRKLPDRRAAA